MTNIQTWKDYTVTSKYDFPLSYDVANDDVNVSAMRKLSDDIDSLDIDSVLDYLDTLDLDTHKQLAKYNQYYRKSRPNLTLVK